MIWTTLAVAATRGAARGGLTLDNARRTCGALGPVRTATRVLPADSPWPR